jgi:hypothetical protein
MPRHARVSKNLNSKSRKMDKRGDTRPHAGHGGAVREGRPGAQKPPAPVFDLSRNQA